MKLLVCLRWGVRASATTGVPVLHGLTAGGSAADPPREERRRPCRKNHALRHLPARLSHPSVTIHSPRVSGSRGELSDRSVAGLQTLPCGTWIRPTRAAI
jgi:hypothetical protein